LVKKACRKTTAGFEERVFAVQVRRDVKFERLDWGKREREREREKERERERE
jgi:hypothetical protein